MSAVLDELLAAARQRSRADARVAPLAELRREVSRLPTARRFEATLRSADRVSVIAEAKRESPSAGTFDLGPGSSAVTALARRYADAGAAALSVLTEPTRFGGSDHDLVAAARIGLPVLRKDFVVDAYSVWQARALGADAVLLIVRALADDLLRQLIATAGEAGLDALVE
ncbi:MAG: indole-3-glycerol-phosphate synthase TrpC, partial [Chloroflexi bacterium]|nr:indole-3-glycerol-phosphate synthase TrpC [Chloroflexota bacterium]